jgi:ubiquinone/menaquinone biosynthesis C-methylase UbiE
MSPPSNIPLDTTLNPAARAAADRYLAAARALQDRSSWALQMFTTLNLFLWHLDGFKSEENPAPAFTKVFNDAAAMLENARRPSFLAGLYPVEGAPPLNDAAFEAQVSGLFSDVWVSMTDDVYFDQSYEFTKARFEKNGYDPEAVFGGKVCVDAGCGSGKFSAALARFGAAKVIGLDIGEKGLDFARRQAAKVSYGDRLEYRYGSLLDIPLQDGSVDLVWSNGVIHHTLNYERCLSEFARILKPGGTLFLYVNGRFGLFELMQDTLRLSMQAVPRSLYQHFLQILGINSGRIYWIMDCCYAPYEWKDKDEVVALMEKYGFGNIRQLTRGVAIDQIEQISTGLPYAEAKYGQGQLKFLATRTG